MKTIQFNEATYAIPDVDPWIANDTFMANIIKNNHSVEEIAAAITDCDDIVVTQYDGEEITDVEHFEGYTEFVRAVYMKDFIIGYDPDTEQDILADVVEISLRGQSQVEILEEQVEKNTADIDYIAMMTDVDIPV